MNQAFSARTFIYLAPAPIFLIVVGAFLWGLSPGRNPRELPSALTDDPVPEFPPPPLEGAGVPGLSSADLRAGEVAPSNVFASWRVSCRAEHPFPVRPAQECVVPIYRINDKDKRSDAAGRLAEPGNPDGALGADENGRISIDRGVYGAPETCVIDRNGVIRYRHVASLFPKVLEDAILPLIIWLREIRA